MSTSGLNRRQLLVSGVAVLAGSAVARAHNGTVHVTIDKLAFTPAEIEVKVGENQRVKKGDLLFRIDPAPYRIALADANAAIASAQVSLATMESNYRGTAVDIAASRDTMRFAQQEYDRQAELMRRGWSEADIRKISGENLLRVMRAVERVAVATREAVEASAGLAVALRKRAPMSPIA